MNIKKTKLLHMNNAKINESILNIEIFCIIKFRISKDTKGTFNNAATGKKIYTINT